MLFIDLEQIDRRGRGLCLGYQVTQLVIIIVGVPHQGNESEVAGLGPFAEEIGGIKEDIMTSFAQEFRDDQHWTGMPCQGCCCYKNFTHQKLHQVFPCTGSRELCAKCVWSVWSSALTSIAI